MTWHRKLLAICASLDPSQAAAIGLVFLQTWEALT